MMKKALMSFIAVCGVLLFSVEARGHSPMGDLSGLFGFTLTAPASYDADSGAFGTGIDLNGGFFYLNGGISFRHWGEEITGWENDRIRNEFAGYAGIGLASMLQIQAGVSNAGTSLRLRSDLIFGKSKRKGPFSGYESGAFAITPFVEASPWAANKKTVFGVGIGISF